MLSALHVTIGSMASLDDLPPYRRAQLLWLNAYLGVDGVEDLVRKAAARPCSSPAPPRWPAGTTIALLGDDGRYHLERADRLLCGDAENTDGRSHRQYCHWMETESGPEEWRGGLAPDGVVWGSTQAEWVVRLVGPAVDPGGVDRHRRCAAGEYTLLHLWPPPPARTASIRRLRAALVDALGPDCHLCGLYPGAMVDHDHRTLRVRGLLCRYCNRVLEECLHITGCPRADYMAAPPAAGLRLLYPASMQWRPRESTRANKIELLGFDPFEGL